MMESFEPTDKNEGENEIEYKEHPTTNKTTTTTTTTTNNDETKKKSDTKSSQSILGLIKTLRIGIGMDVSRVPVPASLLSKYSMLTYLYDSFAKSFDILLKANYIENDLERMLQVFKFVTMLCDNSPETSTKPLNPILGETQISKFKIVDEETNNEISDNHYCVEHIQDEPPFTLACIYNKREGVKVYFNQSIKIIFMGTYFKIPFEDDFNIQFEKYNETFTISFPPLCNRFLRGFSEYCSNGSTKNTIESNISKYYIKSDFQAKPLFGGKYHYCESKVYCSNIGGIGSSGSGGGNGNNKNNINESGEYLYKIFGQWDKELKITNLKTNETNSFFKRPPFGSKKFEKSNDSLDNNNLETDSSIVWKALVDAHDDQDSKLKIKEKNKVEENEKKKEIERKSNNIEWKPIHFKKIDGDNKWELINFLD